jgi:hypothetical protein
MYMGEILHGNLLPDDLEWREATMGPCMAEQSVLGT